MTITLPKGYEPPADSTPGKPFEAVATLVQKDDGTYDLTAISGMPVGESPDDQDPEEAQAPPQSKLQMPWNKEDPMSQIPTGP